MSRDCEVRYIITINALKEGWDCPFAYILASLADKSSAVDVEQILGRVLRQPYVMKHEFQLLNLCYVLTASSKFYNTLDNIVKSLNKAGFSDRDYKLANPVALEEVKKQEAVQAVLTFETNLAQTEDISSDIDTSRISVPTEATTLSGSVLDIEETAIKQNAAFERDVLEATSSQNVVIPNEIQNLVKTYPIKVVFEAEAEKIILPQFFIKVPINTLFSQCEEDQLLEKEYLLKGFSLGKSDTNIAFDNIASELYKVDLDETKKEKTPSFIKIDGAVRSSILEYMLDPVRNDKRVNLFTKRLMDLIGNMFPIPDREIEKYINRILEDFTEEQFGDLAANEYTYKDKIKSKIIALSEKHSEAVFKSHLDTDKVFINLHSGYPNRLPQAKPQKILLNRFMRRKGKSMTLKQKSSMK